MGDLSPHFSREEFRCRDGSAANPHPLLIAALERLRAETGGHPITIVSGYRSPAWNKRVGGATRSQHLLNRAADLRSGVARLSQAQDAGFTGIGLCNGWVVHVDVREGPRVVFKDC